MNLIKAADMLKGAPDSALERYLSNPTGEFPEYLVAAEKTRRDELRKKYSAETQPDKTSIIEEMIQKAGVGAQPKQPPQMPQQVPPEAMGIGSVPPPPGMQMSPAPMMAAAQMTPQQMYDGGVVALAEGGLLNEMQDYLGVESFAHGGDVASFADGGPTNPYASIYSGLADLDIPNPKDVGDQESYFSRYQQMMGPSATAGYEDYLRQQKEDIEKKRGNYLSDFLITAGLGMAGSRRLDPLGAIAEGATQGFNFYQKAKQQDDEAEKNLREAQFKFQQAQRAENMGLLGLSENAYNSAMQRYNTGVSNKISAANLEVNARQAADQANYQAGMLGYKKQELAAEAAKIAERGRLTPKDLIDMRADTITKLGAARKNLDAFYKDASDPTKDHWYRLEKERISRIQSPVERQVAMKRLVAGLEHQYGITPLLQQQQEIESALKSLGR